MLNKMRDNIGRIPLRWCRRVLYLSGVGGVGGGSFLQSLFDNPFPHTDHPLIHPLGAPPRLIVIYVCWFSKKMGGVGTTTSLFWVGCFPLPLLPLPPTCSVVPYHFPYPPPSTHPLWSSSFVYLHFTCWLLLYYPLSLLVNHFHKQTKQLHTFLSYQFLSQVVHQILTYQRIQHFHCALPYIINSLRIVFQGSKYPGVVISLYNHIIRYKGYWHWIFDVSVDSICVIG